VSGERALLVSDVVDSTRIALKLGDAVAARLWADHDRIARDLLRDFGGQEIDRADGFLLLFDRAGDAVAYAQAYHRALASLEVALQARVGVHCGAVGLRRNSDADIALGAKPVEVEGAAKSVAARVAAAACGAQTLLTAAARAALGPTSLRVVSHGQWRMKGVPEPIELFEAGDEQSALAPPPDAAKCYRVVPQGDLWLPVREIRHNLPAERDQFVGRRQALLDLAQRFETGARLVSVLGMGGSGKTRLATRFAWTWLGEYPGGAWFCDLSAARQRDDIASAVAQGLGVPLGDGDPIALLGRVIAGRGHCLVVLDNFEQVARHAPETLGHWLDAAGEAHFLVTTREVLGLPGEQVYALAPLQVAEAVELFDDRAAAAFGGDRQADDDREVVGQLVDLLDRLPLAIELAAARVRVMSARTLLARMDERFRLLASLGSRRDRQATLRATLDWSWDLLNAAERCALAQLSVFEAGFTLEAAEEMLDLSPCDPQPWVVDVVHSLVDKSLVRTVAVERFDLLGSVRAYAAQQLAREGSHPGSGAAAVDAARRRHLAWFAALGPRRAVESGCAELGNLVLACRRAIAIGDANLAVAALAGAWAALSRHGPFSTGAELSERVCDLSGLSVAAEAQARSIHGHALQALGRTAEARAQFEAALRLAGDSGVPGLRARAKASLAFLDSNESRSAQARAGFAAAIELARGIGDDEIEGDALNGLAGVDCDLGRLDDALAHYEAALAKALARGDLASQCVVLGNLGILHAATGAIEPARQCLDQALDLARRSGDRQREGNMLCNLGMLDLVQQRAGHAIEVCEPALRVARDLGHLRLEGIVECNLGLAHDMCGRPEVALVHFDCALAAVRNLGDRRSEGQFLGYQGRAWAHLGRIDAARDCFAAAEALLRDVADPLGLGIVLCDRAECESTAGDAAAASHALAEARSLARSTGAGEASELGQAVARVAARIDGDAAAATGS
jgi:predicted ATPase/class 3 adenylate cyclase/Tfp pilus assembly protein PilF